MEKYKHNFFDNVLSLLVGIIFLVIVFVGWKFAVKNMFLFLGFVIIILFCMGFFSFYELASKTRKGVNLSGFITQSAPIAASSFVAGWTAYRVFKIDNQNPNYLSDLEGNVVLLLISILLAFFSMVALVEGAYQDKYKCKSEIPEQFFSGRRSLMLNLMLVHGILSGVSGFIIPMIF